MDLEALGALKLWGLWVWGLYVGVVLGALGLYRSPGS